MSKRKIDLEDLKKYLESRISVLKEELEILEFLLSLIESGVISKGIESTMRRPKPGEEVIPIRTEDGVHIADMFIGDDVVRVIPLVEMKVSTPPFRSFLINKVLERMRRKDYELVQRGSLSPELALEYKVETEGEVLKEIVVRNIRDDKRKTELKSTIKWTLEKMYEKTRRGLR